MKRFNQWLAQKITNGVATMWCAYLFAAIALISLPKAIASGDSIVIISWIAQTFLQLVLLSIIMVGQKVQAKNLEDTINETHSAAIAEFELAKEARALAHRELRALHSISQDMHKLMKEVEAKIAP
jgi:translation elongation factor EF-1alpha